jgi:cellulose synthase (UDP-forming)
MTSVRLSATDRKTATYRDTGRHQRNWPAPEPPTRPGGYAPTLELPRVLLPDRHPPGQGRSRPLDQGRSRPLDQGRSRPLDQGRSRPGSVRHDAAHRRWIHVPLWRYLAQRAGYGALLTIAGFLAVRFARYWFSAARLPNDYGGRLAIADIVLFSALTFVVWHRLIMDFANWFVCWRIEPRHARNQPQPGLRVAFITTFVPGAEGIGMLARTLASMTAADYPHDTWVLDEGDDPVVQALCTRLGVRHFSRHGIVSLNTEGGRFAASTKGGNHNAWYAVNGHRYDIVAQVDADFAVRHDFLTKTLGHFRDPRVGFVGTPQIYGNTDNLIARGAAEQTYLFYGPLMRALSRRGMSLLIGANHVIRVRALADVGWYNAHLTEDLATGTRLHARRWRSVYVPEPLAVGEGPATWPAYFNQQYRWAFGCLSILFKQSWRVNRRMRPGHALYYFLLEQFYLGGLRMAVGVALLVCYFLFGWRPADLQIQPLILIYCPLLAWGQVMIMALQRFNVRPRQEGGPLWLGRMLTIASIPVFFLALVGVVRNKRTTFKTTPKGSGIYRDYEQTVRVFTPHIALGILVFGCMAVGVRLGHDALVYYAWGILTALLPSCFGTWAAVRWAVAALRGAARAPATRSA